MRLTSRIRALEYLIATAEQGSFTGAARKLGVSVPAVHKLIGALEENISVPLLHREGGSLELTSEGEIYVTSAKAALGHLSDAESQIAYGRSRPVGDVRLALTHVLGTHCVAPRLHQFHEMHPDVNLQLIQIEGETDLDSLSADVRVCLGWTPQKDCITRPLTQTKFLIVAAPSYWARHGMPSTPQDLRNHQCITLRLLKRAIMDKWEFEKDGMHESVPVGGWLISDDRDWIFEVVRSGLGITRVPDIVASRYLESGELTPALLDWQVAEAPPVLISYRSDMRNVPRVQVLVKFLAQIFKDLEGHHSPSHEPIRNFVGGAYHRG